MSTGLRAAPRSSGPPERLRPDVAVLFVRHSKPEMVPGLAPRAWVLSAKGRADAERLGAELAERFGDAEVFASAEPKAIETAQILGLGEVAVDERFGEVAKPWYDSAAEHGVAVGQYLSGLDHDGWESRATALARFDTAVASLGEHALVTTHGTVLSLWLSQRVAHFDAIAFWRGLQMPDAWLFDASVGAVTRVG